MGNCGKITFRELCGKEVINMCDGQKLGHICDIELDTEDYRLTAIIIPFDNGSIMPFGKKEYYVIPLCRTECLGNDAVLVKVSPAELICCELYCKKKPRKER